MSNVVPPAKDWFVARTIPQKEEIARVNLERQGIEAFLPRFWKTYRRAKRFEDRLCPLFPGYIFFQSEADPVIWRNVSGTLGVSFVLWAAAGALLPCLSVSWSNYRAPASTAS